VLGIILGKKWLEIYMSSLIRVASKCQNTGLLATRAPSLLGGRHISPIAPRRNLTEAQIIGLLTLLPHAGLFVYGWLQNEPNPSSPTSPKSISVQKEPPRKEVGFHKVSLPVQVDDKKIHATTSPPHSAYRRYHHWGSSYRFGPQQLPLKRLPPEQIEDVISDMLKRHSWDDLAFISIYMTDEQRKAILGDIDLDQIDPTKLTLNKRLALVGIYEGRMALQDLFGSEAPELRVQLKSSKVTPGHSSLTNLHQEVEKFEPVFGREPQIQSVINLLGGEKSANPLLLGETGVGKTAIVEEIVRRIEAGNVPDHLKNKEMWSLSLLTLSGLGAKWGGLLEKHLGQALECARQQKNVILFVDEIHLMVKLGSASDNPAKSVGQFLKTELTKGEIPFIGATTAQEFDEFFAQVDPALARRFSKVNIPPFDEATAETITRKIFQRHCESTSSVYIPPETIRATVKLAKQYLRSEYSPSREKKVLDESIGFVKAAQNSSSLIEALRASLAEKKDTFRFLQQDRSFDGEKERISISREICALGQQIQSLVNQEDQQVNAKSKIDELARELESLYAWKNEAQQDKSCIEHVFIPFVEAEFIRERISCNEVFPTVATPEIVSKVLGAKLGFPLPYTSINKKNRADILSLKDRMNEKVIGQPYAVEAVSQAWTMFRSGVRPPNKPIGSFLFLGPTGVGKTLLAQTLAEEISGTKAALLQYNMGQYQNPYALQEFFEEVFVRQIRKFPHAVVVLDEFEKSHPDIYKTFMQVLDEGKVRTRKGEIVDCSHAYFIMTSNIGAKQMLLASQSQKNLTEVTSDLPPLYPESVEIELARKFPPEFLNRVEIIPFAPLSKESVRKAIQEELKKEVAHIEEEQNIHLEWDESVIQYLLKNGYSFENGIRPLQHLISKTILHPLAELVLENRVQGNRIKCYMSGGRGAFKLRLSLPITEKSAEGE
jgi:ATP-dependent Clp protease ATP-binding subunit ClpA